MHGTGRPPINLSHAPGARESWGRSPLWVAAWWAVEWLLVRSAQPSSWLRIAALRCFGARIGPDVIARPGLRVRFPWKLTVGARSWLGEDVWLHNQDDLVIGSDVVISQDSFVTTGTHDYRTDMALITRPVRVCDGVWLTSRTMVLGGVTIGESALVLPLTVVRRDVPENSIYGSSDGRVVGQRFPPGGDGV